ncbi:hypothetical protein EES41_00530 [Streptomyces sp. ADI95-16]|uniref:hypothetical protein n=1 Tax=Streptomyces sp. ADI95-16 TaxID=1522758 RepID=UPI000F42FF62|nr:hypothetical protein [Streptomyces sp. ADI95-16]AYV25212.1 hypothetical protein EES41_00530 [Streptomyces sp. ADI95-16]
MGGLLDRSGRRPRSRDAAPWERWPTLATGAFILLLASRRGVRKGLAFLLS